MAWTTAAKSADLPAGTSRIVTLNGKQIGLFNDRGTIRAVLNFCPHMGAPICQGGKIISPVISDSPGTSGLDSARRVLRCPWHHWEFDLQSGKALANTREKIKLYATEIRDGDIWVDV